MGEPLRNVAVVLAGGVGTRIGAGIPKQLIEIAGRTILEHTITKFEEHPGVDEIIVMMAPAHLDAASAIVHDAGFAKVVDVLAGADTRSGTTMKALARLGEDECNVLLHDAARPLVTHRIIDDCLRALQTHAAVGVAIPSADTVIEITEANTISAVPPRARLRRAQTPQCFRASVIREAYARAMRDPGFTVTDDCSVVFEYMPDVPILAVQGDERNIKITEPTDVHLAELLLRLSGEEVPTPHGGSDQR